MKKVIVILGTHISGTEPGEALRLRLEYALSTLCGNDLPALVTGGTLPPAHCSEAEVMKNWLITHGIEKSRLLTEDSADSSYSNLVLSREILDHTFGPGMYEAEIITSGYHVFRVRLIARELGFSCRVKGAPSPKGTLVYDILRECLGIGKYLILGNRPIPWMGGRR